MKTPKITEIIEHFYKELEMPRVQLNQWELNFIESTKDYFDRTGHLSDKQFEVLERIYVEKSA